MRITPYCIDGLFHIETDPIVDSRGSFSRVYCKKHFEVAGLETTWVQINNSFNIKAGTLRGLHFQTGPAAEAKLVRCLRGKVHDIALDLRRGSATFGCYAAVVLDSDRGNSLYIPAGFAHGFQTIEDGTELQYLHSKFYSPGNEGGVDALDPELAVDWPLPVTVRSDRDAGLPSLTSVLPL